jgi:hypothetical protein
MQQCGPYHCEQCGASEIGPYDKERELTAQERDAGWYAPASEPGSSANIIGGRIVSHVQARDAYQDEFAGNPLWQNEKYVANWWQRQRKQ